MNFPLKGIRVVELARVLAGPWIGQTLADLGAEVLKIESPMGDETRAWGPPYVRIGDQDVSAYFLSCNRGKQSIVADFRDPNDRDNLIELIAEADIVIENFKVGGLEKYGLDYKSLSVEFPKLIYCSVSGFGQDGPYAHRAGYDFLIQGMSGFMDITGAPEGEPQKIGVALSDIITGLYGVIAVQAALWEREQSGLGQLIDVSLLDCMTGVLANQGLNYLATHTSPKRMGNAHPNICPYATFPSKDGHLIIAVGNDGQFARLCQVIGLESAASNPHYATNAARVEHRLELTRLISAQTSLYSRNELLSKLEKSTVPAAPINTIAELFSDPQIIHRQMQISPQGTPSIRNPIRFGRSNVRMDVRAPLLGEHAFNIKNTH